MRTVSYQCPKCQTSSDEMKLLGHFHQPTESEFKNETHLFPVATEVLLCQCGLALTWFALEAIEENTIDCGDRPFSMI